MHDKFVCAGLILMPYSLYALDGNTVQMFINIPFNSYSVKKSKILFSTIKKIPLFYVAYTEIFFMLLFKQLYLVSQAFF